MPTPPRTPAQHAASRLNGSKSHGPTTPDGRRASSRNATKHGLSGEGKNLPLEMEHELASEISLFSSQFHPRSDYEHDLIRRAALGNLRARRISDTLNTLCDDRARHATRIWDETRASEISSLADQLSHDPSTSVSLLRRTTEGCDYLADALDSLAQTLQSHGFLDESQSLNLLNLLGHPEPPSLKDESNPLHPLWICLLSLQFDHNPRPLLRSTFRHFCPPNGPENHTTTPEIPHSDPQISHQTHVRNFLPDPSDARADLAQFLQTQIADLEAQAQQNWELYDLPSRESAPMRAAFDSSPETVLLNRYLTAAERMRRQSLDELHRLRKTSGATGSASAQPNGPEPPTPAPHSPLSTPHSPSSVQNEPEPPRPTPQLNYSDYPTAQYPIPTDAPSSPAEAPDPAFPMHFS